MNIFNYNPVESIKTWGASFKKEDLKKHLTTITGWSFSWFLSGAMGTIATTYGLDSLENPADIDLSKKSPFDSKIKISLEPGSPSSDSEAANSFIKLVNPQRKWFHPMTALSGLQNMALTKMRWMALGWTLDRGSRILGFLPTFPGGGPPPGPGPGPGPFHTNPAFRGTSHPISLSSTSSSACAPGGPGLTGFDPSKFDLPPMPPGVPGGGPPPGPPDPNSPWWNFFPSDLKDGFLFLSFAGLLIFSIASNAAKNRQIKEQVDSFLLSQNDLI